MRAISVSLAAVFAVIAVSCDSGGGSGEDQEDLVAVDEGSEPQSIACSKTSTCEWGNSCQKHKCVVPDGQNPGKAAYDFVRKDECDGSPTAGQDIALSDYHGKVILLYFATSTCDACKADVKVYEGLIDQLEFKGFVGMAAMITVMLPMSASALPAFAAPLHTPVVVDDDNVAIAVHYKAAKDTVVLIDKAGYIRETYPSLEVRGAAPDKAGLTELLTQMASESL